MVRILSSTYPIYMFQGLRRCTSSKTEMHCCCSTWSNLLFSCYFRKFSFCILSNCETIERLVPTGIVGTVPGLGGRLIRVPEIIPYLEFCRVNSRRPRFYPPRLEATEALFVFNLLCTSQMIMYIDSSGCFSSVEKRNPSLIVSIVVDMCSVLRIMDYYLLNKLYDRSVFFFYMKCVYVLYTISAMILSDNSRFNYLQCWNCLASRLSDSLICFVVDALNN